MSTFVEQSIGGRAYEVTEQWKTRWANILQLRYVDGNPQGLRRGITQELRKLCQDAWYASTTDIKNPSGLLSAMATALHCPTAAIRPFKMKNHPGNYSERTRKPPIAPCISPDSPVVLMQDVITAELSVLQTEANEAYERIAMLEGQIALLKRIAKRAGPQ